MRAARPVARPRVAPPTRPQHKRREYATSPAAKKSAPWWKDEKIKFKCTGCGKCCTGKPGYVWLLEEDMVNMTKHLGMERAAFMDKYVRYIPEAKRYSLKEVVSENWRCILLSEMKYCSVYPVRPTQCRTYPYWPAVMSSKERWEEEAAESCEGINHKDADVVPITHVQQQLDEQFKRVIAPHAFKLDIGPPPPTPTTTTTTSDK